MFTIYQQIANRLHSKLPVLKTIDYDKGQLADPEKNYALDFPAVLISLEDIGWKDGGNKSQRGDMVISITVAVSPINNSRQDSPVINNFVGEMAIISQVFAVLKGYSGGDKIVITEAVEATDDAPAVEEVSIIGDKFSSLTRTRTQRMKRYDEIQAYTHLFTTAFTDTSAEPVYVAPPADITPIDLEMTVKTPKKEESITIEIS